MVITGTSVSSLWPGTLITACHVHSNDKFDSQMRSNAEIVEPLFKVGTVTLVQLHLGGQLRGQLTIVGLFVQFVHLARKLGHAETGPSRVRKGRRSAGHERAEGPNAV